MNRRRASLAMAILCALVLGAAAAQGAQAAGHTAFTCVEGATGFADAHCTGPDGGGDFGHVAIEPGTKTELTGEATTPQIIEVEPFGLEIVMTATGLQLVESTIVNTDHGTEPMDVSGTVRLTYSDVTTNLEGCAFEDPAHGPGTITTEPLSYTSQPNGNVKLVPASGSIFAVMHMVNAPGKTCLLSGEFNTEAGFLEVEPVGATLRILPEQQELTMLGAPMTLAGTWALSGGKGGEEHHPIALTESA